jgi:hypothetical protein
MSTINSSALNSSALLRPITHFYRVAAGDEHHGPAGKVKIEDLRIAHERAVEYERQCIRALAEAREKTNQSQLQTAWVTLQLSSS